VTERPSTPREVEQTDFIPVETNSNAAVNVFEIREFASKHKDTISKTGINTS
jgi:hypothetical protein